jgi:hypothetical protein
MSRPYAYSDYKHQFRVTGPIKGFKVDELHDDQELAEEVYLPTRVGGDVITITEYIPAGELNYFYIGMPDEAFYRVFISKGKTLIKEEYFIKESERTSHSSFIGGRRTRNKRRSHRGRRM